MKLFTTIKNSSSKWITHTLLLSIIPVILFGTVIYYMGSRMVQEEIHRSSMESLSQVRHQVESELDNIERMTNQIALQSDIIEVMNATDQPALGSSPRTNQVRGQLSRMKNVSDTVHSIYFYHLQQRMIISTDIVTAIDESRMFRDLSWLDSADEMMKNRRHQMWVTPRELVSPNGDSISTLTHLRVLPLFYNQAKAVIVVNLNPEFLNHSISRFPLGADGKLLVMNAEGQWIAQIPRTENDEQQLKAILTEMSAATSENTHTTRVGNNFLSVLQSESSGWKYAIVVPSHVPRQQVEQFGRLIMIITVILCLLVVYSAYFTHNTFQSSIRSVLERLSLARASESSTLKGDAISEIENHIKQLIGEVKQGQSRHEIHLPLLRAHYLHALVHGNAVDISRMARQMEKNDIFPHANFCVMVAQMDDATASSFEKERELFLFAVSNIGTELPKLQKEGQTAFRLEAMITDQHTVFIVNYVEDKTADQIAVRLADQLRSVVKQILKHTITVGVGTVVNSAHDLVYSYREALQALRMNLANAYDEVLPYANMTIVAERLVQYPAAEEQSLLNGLRTRDRAAAERSLLEFRAKLESNLASFNMAKTFYLQLVVAVIRLVQEYEEDIGTVFDGENPYDAFFRMESVPRIHDWFDQQLITPILHYMDSVKRRKTDFIVRSTLDLIHERYASDLSLQMAADEMGISVSYLSKLFKDELGETFIDYVTRLRLEKAQALLVETDLTMQQIADAIGYTSVQQMFRVFKKRLDMTPGEYRERSTRI